MARDPRSVEITIALKGKRLQASFVHSGKLFMVRSLSDHSDAETLGDVVSRAKSKALQRGVSTARMRWDFKRFV